MKKYIFALILGCGIVFQGQSVYAQVEDIASENSYSTQTVDKNILADKELMSNITPEQLKGYISRGADADAKDSTGDTPLVFAALFNPNPEIIKILAESGANVNKKVNDKVPVLLLACANNSNPKVIQTLIEAGATVEHKDSILKFLNENENIEKNQDYWDLIDIISSTAKKIDKNILINEELMKNISTEQLEEYISQGADVNAKDALGATPLMLAAQFNENHKIVEILLDNGADPDIQDAFGLTPLKIAGIYNNNPEIIKILIKNSEDAVDDVEWIHAHKMKKNCKNAKSQAACECMIPIISKKLPFTYKLEVVLGIRNIKTLPMEYFDETDFLACATYRM